MSTMNAALGPKSAASMVVGQSLFRCCNPATAQPRRSHITYWRYDTKNELAFTYIATSGDAALHFRTTIYWQLPNVGTNVEMFARASTHARSSSCAVH